MAALLQALTPIVDLTPEEANDFRRRCARAAATGRWC